MALESLSLRNDVGEHWCAANTPYGDGDAGTPGAANSCGPSTPIAPIVINEIMQNPAGVPDSVGEWFELLQPDRHRRRHRWLDHSRRRLQHARHRQRIGRS